MKKIIIVATIICAAVFANAAQVGWTNGNLAAYNGDKYYMFVIGQNGATSIATITTLLDAGSAVDSYSIGGGTVSSGTANLAASATSPTLGEGSYTAFMVLFDAATPTSGSSKYAVLQGAAGYNQSVGAATATITFVGGNAGGMASAAEWKTYGAPEPTSGVLLLLGVAGLALKRHRA